MEKLTNTLNQLGQVTNPIKNQSCEQFKTDLYCLIRNIVHHSTIQLSKEQLIVAITEYVFEIQRYGDHNNGSDLYKLCDEYLRYSLNDICRHDGCLKLFGGIFSTDTTKLVVTFIPQLVNLVFNQQLALFQQPIKTQKEELLLLVESEYSMKIEDLWYCGTLLSNENHLLKFEFSPQTHRLYTKFMNEHINNSKFGIMIRQHGKFTKEIIDLLRFIDKVQADQIEDSYQQECLFIALKNIISFNNNFTINYENANAPKSFLLQIIELYATGYLPKHNFLSLAQTLSDEISV